MTSPDPSATREPVPAPRFGRHGPRSRTGCTTCRTRKVKCDETRDVCNRCAKAQIHCEWDQPVRNRRPTKPPQTTAADRSSLSSFPADAPQTSGPATVSPPLINWTSSVASEASSNSPISYPIRDLTSGKRHSLASPVLASPSNVYDASLSPEELESFDYIPRSFMVLSFGKPWRWSMLCHVHSTIARREKGVMRAFIAVASMELRTRELDKTLDISSPSDATQKARAFKTNARNSLNLAMQDLSHVLKRVFANPNDLENLEALFSMWFLILHFGMYDEDLVETSYMHLNGIRSFTAEYFHGDNSHRIYKLPPAAKQLLLFTCYLDIQLAVGGMGGGRLASYLVSAPKESPVQFSNVFEEARVCLPQIWGSEYPVDELIDDVENYRPLRLLFECQILKLATWELGVLARRGDIDPLKMHDLWCAIQRHEEFYCDLFLLARQIPNTGGRRVVWTIYHAVLDHIATKILYSCITDVDTVPAWLESSLADLLTIAHKAINEDPEHVYRYAWPMNMALFKVRDPIHRDWLQIQVRKASLLLSNMGIPSKPTQGLGSYNDLFVESNTPDSMRNQVYNTI